ncbi:pilus assembly protein TadG-related protein [Mesorhizobium ciceri]|uniref:TadE/TadG family type IV pilus assembly protein n=1 Tax=Mesorhizobium ciceri TaxID=39645 RepID=UPI0007A9514F|nr:pilus assembly protein TadG-related protein [Mesorhizobium ciceri]AMY01717.1 hypothetical protein A4R29_21145 [Mesorhizobium ciceri biovar biserrulae]
MLGTIRAFWNDQRGIAMILVAIMLPVIIGFSLLVIDMSRANSLHNDLQKGADAFALAAAAELDGGTDAIIRANSALATLVNNTYRFSDQGNQQTLASSGTTWRYLSSLPANDSDPITSANVTTDATLARFIEVTVTPTGFAAIFPASFLSGNSASNSFTVGARAVAGFNSAVCDLTPVFMCNPYEMVNGTNAAGGITLQQAVTERRYRRRLIQLRTVGGGAAYFPGNFGFLSTDGNGAKDLATALASSKPQACFSKRGVTTETGQKAGKVKAAINLRFGMEEPGTPNAFKTPEFGPASNVRKGGYRNNSGNTCPGLSDFDFDVAGKTQSLGLDNCFATGNCPYLGGRMGDGTWNFTTYWNINHRIGNSANPKPIPSDIAGTGTNLPTRYEVYRSEISHSLIADPSPNPAKETGVPENKCQPAVTTVDRRLLYGAIINCQALQADPNVNLSGKTPNLPVEAFASFFLTQPIRTDRCTGKGTTCFDYDADIFVELVDVTGHAGQGTLNNFLRDEPQLYR